MATAELDASFFRARFDRLTPLEKRYLRAMAERGPGPHRSGEVAETLGRSVGSVAPTRANLIAKGMVYSPGHGDTAFTVPLFDLYLRRRPAVRSGWLTALTRRERNGSSVIEDRLQYLWREAAPLRVPAEQMVEAAYVVDG